MPGREPWRPSDRDLAGPEYDRACRRPEVVRDPAGTREAERALSSPAGHTTALPNNITLKHVEFRGRSRERDCPAMSERRLTLLRS